MENPNKPTPKTKIKAGSTTFDPSSNGNLPNIKAKTCPPPPTTPPPDICKTRGQGRPLQNAETRSDPTPASLASDTATSPRASEGLGLAQLIQNTEIQEQSAQAFSQRQYESSPTLVGSGGCTKYNFLKLLQPGNGSIELSRCCPYGDMQFPCSWFASPKYFHMCTTRRCCKSVCLFHDDRKVCKCVGSKCNELGPRVSSNTLHGVRSVNDLRSWSVCCEDQRRYFLEQMLKSRGPVQDVEFDDDIPQEASPMQIRYENLLNKKEEEIERLKKKILELQQKQDEPAPSRKKSDPKTPPRKKSVEFKDIKSETPHRKPSDPPPPVPSVPRKKSSVVEPEPAPSPPRKKSSLVEPEPVPSLPRKKSSVVEPEPVPSPPRKKSSLVETEAAPSPPRKKSSLIETEPAPSPPREKSSVIEPEQVPSPPRKKSSIVEPEPVLTPPSKKSSVAEPEPISSETEAVATPPRKASSGYESMASSSPKKVSEGELVTSEALEDEPTISEEVKEELTAPEEIEEELFPDASETLLEGTLEQEPEEAPSETDEPPPEAAPSEIITQPEPTPSRTVTPVGQAPSEKLVAPPNPTSSQTPVAQPKPTLSHVHVALPDVSQSKTPLPVPSSSQPFASKAPPQPPTKQKSLPHFTPVQPGLLSEPRTKKEFRCSSCEKPSRKPCPVPAPVYDEGLGLPLPYDLDLDMPIEDPYNLIVKLVGNKIVKSQAGQVLEVLEPEELVAELEWLRESMMANGERVHELEDALFNREEVGVVGFDYDQYGAQIEELNSQLEVMREEHGFLESRLVEKEMNEKHLHITLESTASQLNQYREESERSRILLQEAEDRIQELVQRIMELESSYVAAAKPDPTPAPKLDLVQQQPWHPPGPCGQIVAYVNNFRKQN
ncbi:unnamed protein product [Orchesella dallaii]|uniref:Uncharacterized protein n=1 Tax=Orchesella dallaii TaxID=48710 RepID=A0ABP1PT84_9HEXA